MTRVRVALLVALPAAALAVSMLVAARAQQTFPHQQHAGLFPLCIGCHIGVETGDVSAYYPPPESCATCHDGVSEAVVDWRGPSVRTSNLRFEHLPHAARLAAEGLAALECADCHSPPGAPRMTVQPPVAERCMACHAHTATDHFVDADCRVCHEPLIGSGLPAARIAALPVPASHERADFLPALHGTLAAAGVENCATCHAREQCTSCHVRVPAGSPIAAVPAALGTVAVPLPSARYPVPASHLDPAWERTHGRVATPETCGACHTRESCASCHTAPLPRVVVALSAAADVDAPGVQLARRAPQSHATPFFATQHGSYAAGRPQSCATCHDRVSFCAACHDPAGPAAAGPAAPGAPSLVLPAGHPAVGDAQAAGAARQRAASAYVSADASPAVVPYGDARPRAALAHWRPAEGHAATVPIGAPDIRPLRSDTPPALPPQVPAPGAAATPRSARGFHPPNYVLRHSAEAYGRRLDCASCHNTQLFCRDCHTTSGRGSAGRLGAGYHDAEPVWLLRHGQAARQTLESCTSCHTQRDCMQCHSQLGAFRVSPHGPNFDARRAQRTNPQICRACHLADPLVP